MMTVLIQHDFLFAVTYQSVISCPIVHTITVSFVLNQKKLNAPKRVVWDSFDLKNTKYHQWSL